MTAVRASMSVPLSDPRPLDGGITANILAQINSGSKTFFSPRSPRAPGHLLTRSAEADELPPEEGSAARKSRR
jgi:hypothetical protein